MYVDSIRYTAPAPATALAGFSRTTSTFFLIAGGALSGWALWSLYNRTR